jgi:CRISPR type III-B/RAMP module-associated protein Cmr5
MTSEKIETNVKHECARYAYKCIRDVTDNIKPKQGKYRSEVRSTGTRIHDAGLMQTLAFYCSKVNDEVHFKKLALHIMKWTLRNEKVGGQDVDTSKWEEGSDAVLKLFEHLLNQSVEKIIMFTADATEVVQWLSRFAEAKLEKEK